MRPLLLSLTLILAWGCRPPPSGAVSSSPPAKEAASTLIPSEEEDLAAARALFEKNIRAIQEKDREAYLSCYRDDAGLIRAGASGPALGFEGLATSTSTAPESWPIRLEASELSVHPVAPGVVYGSYRYEVEFDGTVRKGWSERVFIKTKAGFRIAVSTAFDD